MKKLSSLILMGLSFSVGAETILNFNASTLDNITSVGDNSLFNGPITVPAGGEDFIISPHDSLNGEVYAAKIGAVYGGPNNISVLRDFLGILDSETIENQIRPLGSDSDLQPTSFGFGGTTIDLIPNKNYSFYWATANSDYIPFSDGTFFALSLGQELKKFDILSRLSYLFPIGVDSSGNAIPAEIIPGTTPGYKVNTMVFQSFGASSWIKKSFTVDVPGTYKIAFGVFNSIDTLLTPYLFLSDLQGETVGADENAQVFSFFNTYPTPDDTNTSLQLAAYQLRGAYNSQVAASNLSLNHDCNLFDTKGLCISAGGRYTTIDNPNTNASVAVVTLGYKVNANIRMGGFLDQNVNTHSPSSINITNKNPLMGVYAVWNKEASGLGYQVRLANTYQDKDVTTTRIAYGDTGEAGSGTAKLNSQSYLAELSYAFQYQDKTLVRPYFGLRYTKLKRNGYTEKDDFAAPLAFDALTDRSTSALIGARVNYQATPKTTLTANLGIEQDLHHKVDNFAAANDLIGYLDPITFNSNIKRTRPVASAGVSYDVTQAQRLSGTVSYQQLPFQATGATSLYVNYMIGF